MDSAVNRSGIILGLTRRIRARALCGTFASYTDSRADMYCLCVSCVGRAPCVGRSLCVSGALCVGALCVGRSPVGPSAPVSVPRYVDIRSRDGSRTGARSHGCTNHLRAGNSRVYTTRW